MRPPIARLLRRTLRPLAALLLLTGAARATWSVVVVDTQTGEVCVASATCLADFDLERWVPVMRVGIGGAAAQSSIDTGANNRTFIYARMGAGLSPRWILQALPSIDNQHQNRQYGMVTLEHNPQTFTGANAGFARFGVTGQHGTLKYAIQGNLLTGNAVVTAAEHALRQADGDLGQRVMRAMRAAARMGGDGRCSCSPGAPTTCGTPPATFDQSAQVAFIVLSRIGDVDGVCNETVGCASGSYYLDEQFITNGSGPDPVQRLQRQYDDWRATLVGRPDHILSQVDVPVDSLVADGVSATFVTVRLVDVDGNPLMGGGASLTVDWTGTGAPVATPGPVGDNGDGSYVFELRATTTAGEGSWAITVDDGVSPVRLHPDLALRVDPLAELHAGDDTVSLSEGADVPFTINRDPADHGRPYLLLGSTSGTVPGQDFHGIHLALNADPFFLLTLQQPGPPNFPGSMGFLDAQGRAEAGFVATPAELAAFGGSRFDWVAVIGGGGLEATNGVGFDVVP
jgi:uncharacterized Ntn-hydrolase superfamily protein